MDKQNNWMQKVMFWVTVGAIAICALGIFLPCFGIEQVDKSNIIITFVGVLSAFVVIGNYTQTSDMRERTENKIKDLEKQLKESEKQLKEAEKIYDGLSKTIEKFQKKYDIVIKMDLVRIINGKGGQGQSGAFGNIKKVSDITEVHTDDGKEYVVKFSDEVFIVDIVEETAFRK